MNALVLLPNEGGDIKLNLNTISTNVEILVSYKFSVDSISPGINII